MAVHQTLHYPNVKKNLTPCKTSEMGLAPIIEMQYCVQINGDHHIVVLGTGHASRYNINKKYE